MNLRSNSVLFSTLLAFSLLVSCSKSGNSTNTPAPGSPFWKGYVNTQVWEHGAVIGTNGKTRYYFSSSGGSMSDTASSNVQKYDGTYTIPAGTDSIYISCSSPNNVTTFKLRGKYNSAKTSISGEWKMSSGGITNTLPFSLVYLQ